MTYCDDHTFEGIYREYRGPLFLFAKNIVSHDDAIDIVTEAFVKVWNREIDHENIKSYLFKTVRNMAINVLRRNKMLGRHHRLMEEKYFEESVVRAEIESELIEEVRQKLKILSPKEAIVFKMAFFDGKENKEIAQEMALNYQTVGNLKSLALAKIKSSLKKN